MSDLHQQLAQRPGGFDGVRLVSFSLDPQRDTPEVLAEYADALDATPDDWAFLRGPQQDVWSLSQDGFKLAVYESGDPDNPIGHTGKIVLVDRQGMIRGFYDGLTPEGMAELRRDLIRLLEGDDASG
jgi:protein SCO1/2